MPGRRQVKEHSVVKLIAMLVLTYQELRVQRRQSRTEQGKRLFEREREREKAAQVRQLRLVVGYLGVTAVDVMRGVQVGPIYDLMTTSLCGQDNGRALRKHVHLRNALCCCTDASNGVPSAEKSLGRAKVCRLAESSTTD